MHNYSVESPIYNHRQVTLNGDVLKVTADAAIPDLMPKEEAAGDILQLPALSFGYYVFKNVKANACMNNQRL